MNRQVGDSEETGDSQSGEGTTRDRVTHHYMGYIIRPFFSLSLCSPCQSSPDFTSCVFTFCPADPDKHLLVRGLISS